MLNALVAMWEPLKHKDPEGFKSLVERQRQAQNQLEVMRP